MGMFQKKKKPLFGGDIEPSCLYCVHNGGTSKEAICTAKGELKDGKCKKYVYDPLMREPKSAPPLRNQGFTPEDFHL